MMIIFDITFKDLTRSFRSAFVIGMTIIAPLLLVGLFYIAFDSGSSETLDLPRVKLGVVNADRLPPGTSLVHPLGEDIRRLFIEEDVKSWITTSDYADEASARAAVDIQDIDMALIIPHDLTKNILLGDTNAHVLIISDPSLKVASKVVQNMVIARLDGMTGERIAIQTIVERHRVVGLQPEKAQILALIDRYYTWYEGFQRALSQNPERAVLVMVSPAAGEPSENPLANVLGPMMTGQMIFFAFFTGAYSMMSILRESDEGTLARLFTTPVRRTSILMGKFISVFLSVIIQGVVLITAAHFAFGINWGNPPAVFLALLGQVIAASGLGVFMISFVKTTQQGGPLLGGGLTVLGVLGGLFTSGLSMPEAFTRLAIFTPQGWVIKTWKVVLDGQPLSELMLPFVVMTLMGVVMFTIGAMMFRRRFAL